MQVRSLSQDDPLEEGMATHSSILAWRIPMDRGSWRAIDRGVAKSWTRLSDLTATNMQFNKHAIQHDELHPTSDLTTY